MTPTERVLEERAKHLADEINKGHYVTVDDLLEQFTLARREALLEAANTHESDCNVVLDDISDQVLKDYQTCTCDRTKAITALADKESERG